MSKKNNIDTFVVSLHESEISIQYDKISYNIVLPSLTNESLNKIYGKEKWPSTYSLYTWQLSMMHGTWIEYNDLPKNGKINNKKYNNLYLNHTRRPRSHRVQLLNQLYNHGLIDYGINTFSNPEQVKDDDGVSYETYPWFNYINNYDKTSDEIITESYINHDAAIELVTETEVEYINFTEKTWKPILNRHPFLILGGRGIHKHLKSLGFHLFEEIFDYSFDDSDNEQERIMGIVDNLKKLKKLEPYKIMRYTKKKVMDNYEKLHEYRKYDTTCPNEFIQNISQYDKIIFFSATQHEFITKIIINSMKKLKSDIHFDIINNI